MKWRWTSASTIILANVSNRLNTDIISQTISWSVLSHALTFTLQKLIAVHFQGHVHLCVRLTENPVESESMCSSSLLMQFQAFTRLCGRHCFATPSLWMHKTSVGQRKSTESTSPQTAPFTSTHFPEFDDLFHDCTLFAVPLASYRRCNLGATPKGLGAALVCEGLAGTFPSPLVFPGWRRQTWVLSKAAVWLFLLPRPQNTSDLNQQTVLLPALFFPCCLCQRKGSGLSLELHQAVRAGRSAPRSIWCQRGSQLVPRPYYSGRFVAMER